MEDLIELSKVVSKLRTRNIEILNKDDKGTKLYKLYDGICTSSILSDDEIKLKVYKDKTTLTNTVTKLKSRLRVKLLNTLFFIDSNKSSTSDLLSITTNAHKHWAIVKLLILFGARKTAIQLAEKLYVTVSKYQITDIQFLLAKVLKLNHAVVYYNQKKFQYYSNELTELKEILDAEIFAEDCISNQQILVKHSRNLIIETKNLYQKNIKKLEKLNDKISSFWFKRFYFNYLVRFAEIQDDSKSLVNECENAIREFQKIPFVTPPVYAGFHLRILTTTIYYKDHEKGKKIFDHYKNKLTNQTNNRYAFAYNYILLSIHTSFYSQAFKTLYEYILNKSFYKLSKADIESFNLIEAYVQFLFHINKIDTSQFDLPISSSKKFRINRFLNEVPIHSKQKTVSNVALLIIHVLFLLQMKKHSEIIDRVEALNQYCYRYLRNDDTFRYNCFIKMLIQMTKADFNKKRTVRYCEKLTKKLTAVPMRHSTSSLDVEIIPFEDLWQMILDLLE